MLGCGLRVQLLQVTLPSASPTPTGSTGNVDPPAAITGWRLASGYYISRRSSPVSTDGWTPSHSVLSGFGCSRVVIPH
ncbi:unnamed protein product [Mycena citricolor]|uniref:Uncharacterized protein n=1 Tax=Mycena citricolor TaxID=2018698 RepID=A0AAD2HLC5_9AGAR|nr:unnamed protein product [Mycena citricolor]